MKISIIILSVIFCIFLYRFLYLYVWKDTSLYISLATYIGIIVSLYIKPKEDTHEIQIYESDIESEFEERMGKTRIASMKRKARKLTK